MDNFNIIIIEDETFIALRIKQSLVKHNYTVVGIAQDSEEAIKYIHNNNIHLMLVDITISGFHNGIETVALIQKSFDIPAIFITSHQEDKFLEQASKVNFTGYIIKPFMEETLIREVKLAYLRFYSSQTKSLINLAPYVYDLGKQTLSKNDKEITLSKNEKFFLHILIVNKNKTVSNEQIDTLVWNDNPIDDVNRRHLLFRLRKKLPELDIETIKGIGYRLNI
ncbi:DNA-binding response regulator [Halarcobacter sp.]|uniref:DNA-binding response regulator n=1 Tax=Halarcobacter sp. TaxID=2321133 RepID=UPI002AAB2ECE|nr:DNA-binding response regulator [Halarcobacter sp.]